MNSTPNPAQAALFRSISIRGPLQAHINARTLFKHQELVTNAQVFANPTREERITGQRGEGLRSSAAVGAVTADIARKRRCDERWTLIRIPKATKNPTNASNVRGWIGNRTWTTPRTHRNLTNGIGKMRVSFAGRTAGGTNELHFAGD